MRLIGRIFLWFFALIGFGKTPFGTVDERRHIH